MILYPWADGHWSWKHVQEVWERWQALNVGVLAFLSSLIAFNIASYNANRQRQRNFIASKAFLPSALSELASYFKASSRVLHRAWESDVHGLESTVKPKLPEAYKNIFAESIKYASPEVGEYLSNILVRLQIHDSRIDGMLNRDDMVTVQYVSKQSLLANLYRLGELQALVSLLFDFARGESEFQVRKLCWDDFKNAYANLTLWPEQYFLNESMNLKAFTERQLAKQ